MITTPTVAHPTTASTLTAADLQAALRDMFAPWVQRLRLEVVFGEIRRHNPDGTLAAQATTTYALR